MTKTSKNLRINVDFLFFYIIYTINLVFAVQEHIFNVEC